MNTPEPVDEVQPGRVEIRGGDHDEDFMKPPLAKGGLVTAAPGAYGDELPFGRDEQAPLD